MFCSVFSELMSTTYVSYEMFGVLSLRAALYQLLGAGHVSSKCWPNLLFHKFVQDFDAKKTKNGVKIIIFGLIP